MTDEQMIFWAPSSNWIISDDELIIDSYKFPKEAAALFPDFYEICVQGTNQEKLEQAFHQVPSMFIRRLVKDLKGLCILVEGPQSIGELFQGQASIFRKGEKPDDTFFFNKNNVEAYQREKSLRKFDGETRGEIKLQEMSPGPLFEKRCTVRQFHMEKEISYETFSSFLSVLYARIGEGGDADEKAKESAKYTYPSAGGLYPLDFYLYIKENRVEKVLHGLYRLDPVVRKLYLIDDDLQINKDVHFAVNKDTFEMSAFSVYIFYNADISMPKYQDMAYYYGILDAGFAAASLELHAAEIGLGTCSVGDMRFSKIASAFKLSRNQKHLHTIEVGIPLE